MDTRSASEPTALDGRFSDYGQRQTYCQKKTVKIHEAPYLRMLMCCCWVMYTGLISFTAGELKKADKSNRLPYVQAYRHLMIHTSFHTMTVKCISSTAADGPRDVACLSNILSPHYLMQPRQQSTPSSCHVWTTATLMYMSSPTPCSSVYRLY